VDVNELRPFDLPLPEQATCRRSSFPICCESVRGGSRRGTARRS